MLGPLEQALTAPGEVSVAAATALLQTALAAAATDDSGADGLATPAGRAR